MSDGLATRACEINHDRMTSVIRAQLNDPAHAYRAGATSVEHARIRHEDALFRNELSHINALVLVIAGSISSAGFASREAGRISSDLREDANETISRLEELVAALQDVVSEPVRAPFYMSLAAE